MDIETFRDYCLSKKGAEEGFPFGDTTIVFKVMGKLFAATNIERLPPRANLKCEPELAISLREKYSSVIPGYHMNKKHWNTVDFEGDVNSDEIIKMIDHSYQIVVEGLNKTQKLALDSLA